jgi:hypothetical protein
MTSIKHGNYTWLSLGMGFAHQGTGKLKGSMG